MRGRFKPTDLESLYYAFEMVAKIGLIFAAIFAFIQYNAYQKAERIENSFIYINRYEHGDVAISRKIIRDVLRNEESQIPADGFKPYDHKRWINAVKDNYGNPIEPALDDIADFYEGLTVCTQIKVCSKDIYESYFCPRQAVAIWNAFHPIVTEARKSNPEYALALEKCATAQ